MVVCQLFLQGNCPYGENCSFQHQVNDSAYQFQNTITGNTGGGSKTINLNLLIQSVTTDMLSAEKGGQWLLSSYSPFKEKANFQGFEDRSFEEVRYGYYTARNTGNLDQFVQELQIAQQQAASMIRSLQNPSQEAIATISNIYNSVPVSSNTFGAKNSNSIFGQANHQNQGFFAHNQQQLAKMTGVIGSICRTCGKVVDFSVDLCMSCAGVCERIFHMTCVEIQKSEMNFLMSNSSVKWFCSECIKEGSWSDSKSNMVIMLGECMKIIKNQGNVINKLQDEVKVLNKAMCDLNHNLENLNKKNYGIAIDNDCQVDKSTASDQEIVNQDNKNNLIGSYQEEEPIITDTPLLEVVTDCNLKFGFPRDVPCRSLNTLITDGFNEKP